MLYQGGSNVQESGGGPSTGVIGGGSGDYTTIEDI